MTAILSQARHGPEDMSVDGAGSVVHVRAGELPHTDHNRPEPRGLQVFAKTLVTTSRTGTQRQNLIVRNCPFRCGCEHLHYAPVGVAFVIRQAGCKRGRYAVHSEYLW